METWFVKSVIATCCIVPSFLAIPFLKHRYGVEPTIFMVWYFGGAALGTAVFCLVSGRGAELLPSPMIVAGIISVGLVFGAVANTLLFQAVGLAPNPGLPPVVYATSSLLVFAASAALGNFVPELFRPVSIEVSRLAGILLVLAGLYLLAGGRLPGMSGAV